MQPQYCDSPFPYQQFVRATYPLTSTSPSFLKPCPPLTGLSSTFFECIDGVWTSLSNISVVVLDQLPIASYYIQTSVATAGPLNILPATNVTVLNNFTVRMGALTIHEGSSVKVGGNFIIESNASLQLSISQVDSTPSLDPMLNVGGCVEVEGPVNVKVDTSFFGNLSVPLWRETSSCEHPQLPLTVEVTTPCRTASEPKVARVDSVLAMFVDFRDPCLSSAYLQSPLWLLIVLAVIFCISRDTQ